MVDEGVHAHCSTCMNSIRAYTPENNRLHCDMTRWMVMATDGGAEAQAKGNEALFALTHELSIFNLNLIKDAGDLEMVSDDHRNLRDVIR